MDRLPAALKLFGIPTKAFYQAYRHSQRAIRGGIEGDNPLVGFRVSLIVGITGLMGAYRWPDQRMVFWIVVAFTGFSCAWQLSPFGDGDRKHSGVPKPGWTNWCLSHHAFMSLLMEAIGNGAMAMCIGRSGLFGTTQTSILAVVLILVWLPFCRFIFVNLAVLELLKNIADRRLRIVVFRRFQDIGKEVDVGFDLRHRTVVLPVLGAFGQLFVVHNESLVATQPGPNADSEEVVSQLSKAIKFEHADWVYGVSDLIRETDIAVFHWGSVMSDSMLLELRESQRILSPQRLIIIVDGDGGAMISLLKTGFDVSIHVIRLGDSYSEFLVEVRAAISEMAKSMASAPKQRQSTLAWNSSAYDILRRAAAGRRDEDPLSGIWLLSGSLGEGECDMVFASSHILGRGQDATGWFLIYGEYEVIDGVTQVRGSKQYLGGRAVTFTGQVQDEATISAQDSNTFTAGGLTLCSQSPARSLDKKRPSPKSRRDTSRPEDVNPNA